MKKIMIILSGALLTCLDLHSADERAQVLVGEIVRLIQILAVQSENYHSLNIYFESKTITKNGNTIYNNAVVKSNDSNFVIFCSSATTFGEVRVELAGQCVVDRGSMRHYAGANGVVNVLYDEQAEEWELTVRGDGQLIHEKPTSQKAKD
jgi:hypothetical protein